MTKYSASQPISPVGYTVSHHTDTDEAATERHLVALGLLPARYAEQWAAPFLRAAEPSLRPAARVLDVGSGRRPTLARNQRPPSCEYVGLDISAAELRAAATGSYTDIIVADAVTRVSELEATFDLVISWQALEHVSSLPAALRNFYEYLKPGGRFVSLLSGRYAAFALLGRLIPYRVGVRAMEKLLGVEGDSKFPTRYDQCYYSALTRLLSDWSSWEIIPRYKGGTYFRFARPLERAYLVYENMICRRDWRNLATHYVIVAQR